MWAKRLIALTLLASALAVMPPCLRAQWVQTNGPYGGRIAGLTVMGQNLFASTYEGLVLRSTNNGQNWTLLHKFLVDTGIEVEALDGNLFGYIWAPGTLFSLFQSTDSGVSWTSLMDKFPSGVSVSLPLKFGSNLLVGVDSAVYRSTDNGSTWTAWKTDLMPTLAYGTNLFANSYKGFFRSTDSGASWTNINDGLPPDSVDYAMVAMGKYLLVATLGGIYRSSDEGTSWILVDSSPRWNSSIHIFGAAGPNLFAGTQGSNVYRSLDSGKTWVSADSGLSEYLLSGFAVIDTNLFIEGQYGVSISSNLGKSWSPTALQGYGYSGALTAVDSNLFANWGGNIFFRSTDYGETWNLAELPFSLGSMLADGSNLFAIDGYSIFLSTDLGVRWTATKSKGLSGGACNSVGFDVIGTTLFAATECNGLFFSTDNAASWTAADSGFPRVSSSRDTNEYYIEVESFASNGIYLFAGTWDDGVYMSSDNGISWSRTQNIGLPDTAYVGAIAACGGNLFAGIFDRGIYRSSNNGNSWVRVNNGIIDTLCDEFAVIGSYIFAGMQHGGVYLSSDNGESWISTGLGYQVGRDCFRIVAESLFVATNHDGIWHRSLSDFGISSVTQKPGPTAPQIQSYPNPFSQSTQISFTSASAGYADISIVNLLGEQVAQIFSGELDAGPHNFTFSNTAGLPEGMYECLVRMNGRVETLPMVLMH